MREVLRRVSVLLAVACCAARGSYRPAAAARRRRRAPAPPAGRGRQRRVRPVAQPRQHRDDQPQRLGRGTYDPKTAASGSSRRSTCAARTTASWPSIASSLELRDELNLDTRVYAFGQLQFLEDQFKQIDYLVAPARGIGYKLVATPRRPSTWTAASA
jgi:hypothetical protein